jgi:putative restriction endonuclease
MIQSEHNIRLATFEWLTQQVRIHGEVLPRKLLASGFIFEDERITLVGPQGIWKPRVFAKIPLSITTVANGPYDDSFSPDGLLRYRYQGTNPQHSDNVGLRMAMRERIPLVYFHSTVPGMYLASWPVYIVGDNPNLLSFTVVVDDQALVRIKPGDQPAQQEEDEALILSRRAYITRETRIRLHQQNFRDRVLAAYRTQCACCRLRHAELLDAAHIIPDVDPEGVPLVRNGISLCKLHHSAFDSFLIGISANYVVEVRKDVLEEADGPMLLHGLQGLNQKQILLPRQVELRPDKALLDRRFEQFRQAV